MNFAVAGSRPVAIGRISPSVISRRGINEIAINHFGRQPVSIVGARLVEERIVTTTYTCREHAINEAQPLGSARAKALQLKEPVSQISHAPHVGAQAGVGNQELGEDLSTARLRSRRRMMFRTAAAALLLCALTECGVSLADAGAAIDMSRDQISKMGKSAIPFEVGHLLMLRDDVIAAVLIGIGRRLQPSARARVIDGLQESA